MSSPSAIVAQIRQEAALFDTKDRLLNFSTKNDFQSPLLMETGDLFYEKWLRSKGALPLDSFFQVTPTFNPQQKISAVNAMASTLRQKMEDFGETDLYLVLGFLKWDGNALAPSLLIPLDYDPAKGTLTLANRLPIENVVLRDRLKDTLQLPAAEDAFINGNFSLLLYFSLFEKAIASERNWKFTRHGLCLGFFDTTRLLLKKRLQANDSDKQINGNPTLASLLRNEGFQIQESLFENADFNQVFSPADHHFVYTTDSHTNKVTIDAMNEAACAYAIQALPGTKKMQVAANIVADSVAANKKVLVVHRRAVTAATFQDSWKPPFRTFPDVDRAALEISLRESRKEILEYYDAVNKPIPPAQVPLADALMVFAGTKPSKRKYPDTVFQGIVNLDYPNFLNFKNDLTLLNELYIDKQGVEARKAFQGVKVPSLTEQQQESLAQELSQAAALANKLDDMVQVMESAGFFPTGIFLSSLSDILELISANFDANTPTFEDWQLRSHNWTAYKDTLLALPEAGDKWVRYRRQTSDIYTDNAVDENILSARDDFAESQKATLKGLSDRYRSSRRRLLQVIRHPKNVDSDAKLLDLIDTLLELQANKKSYKESAVLGNHLLGRDWHYEGSNWIELNTKIQYVYDFREKHKGNPKLEFLLQILEKWHMLKDLLPQLKDLSTSVQELQQSIRKISKDMDLETPLESLSLEKWLDKIKSWSENWSRLDIHLQLTALLKKMEIYNCPGLVSFIQNPDNAGHDIEDAICHYWAAAQIQAVTKCNPTLFSMPPKTRSQKSKDYRKTLDQFSAANFSELHHHVESDASVFQVMHLNEALRLSDTFDVAIILDADSISVAEALPIILASQRVIFVGDPHSSNIDHQPYDAYQDAQPHSIFFQESILTAALRQGVPTRELWFSTQYADAALVSFANNRIYNQGIKQLPPPSRSAYKGIHVQVVQDKINAIAKAAIRHAEKNPGKTLGIVAFHHSTCVEIDDAIHAMLMAGTPAAAFFAQSNNNIRYYVKTPERAVDRFRDVVLVCAEVEGNSGINGENKIAVCSTLAKSELYVFLSESDESKQNNAKHSLFWDWISFIKNKSYNDSESTHVAESPIRGDVLEVLQKENITVEETFSHGNIPVGPVIVDNNNSSRFLALIEDDCTTERFRDSVEDRDYIRPMILKQLGWKVMNLWLPFWFMSKQDEVGHLVATIAIEQSIAPPPIDESAIEDDSLESAQNEGPVTEPYVVQHPKIEGTPHDKPIAELPVAALITQLKFYVDYESPIHEEILKLRVLELHHVDRAGPMLQKALTDALNLGLQKKRFVKTGPFYYSLKPQGLVPRNRANRPDFERKLAFVSPEERALMPPTMDEHALKLAMGLLE